MDAENSDTPRTDAVNEMSASITFIHFKNMREHARQLERELSEAKEIISHFGWTSSDSTEVILKAERWLAAHPEEKK